MARADRPLTKAGRVAAHRRGFTLWELLIVVAIFVVVLGAAWPQLRSALEKTRLHDAAKGLRVTLSRCRLDAIESGLPRQFRYQPRSNVYELSVYTFAEDSSLPGAEGQPGQEPAVQEQLPHGVQFAALTPSDPNQPQGLVEEWSNPVLFYPNGHSTNALIRLRGADNHFVDVTIRGMMGIAKVGRVQHEETPP